MFRVAAYAAAATSLCAAAGFAGPLLASEAGAAAATTYIAHVGAMPVLEAPALDETATIEPAPEIEVPSAAAVHAMAPSLPGAAPAADEPAAVRGRPLAELVAELAGSETPDAESDCLARAVYYESKGEPLAGQLTVAEVILNRAGSGRFPSTICAVVRQPGQFSFVRRGHIPTPPAASRDWRTAVAIARIAIQDLADGAAPRALFFHARHVRPGWRHTRVATIGNHVFYR